MAGLVGRRSASPTGQQSLHTIPIADRPPHGPFASKVLFPLLMVFGLIGISSTTILAIPLLLLPGTWGITAMDHVVAYTKDGFGRLREQMLASVTKFKSFVSLYFSHRRLCISQPTMGLGWSNGIAGGG